MKQHLSLRRRDVVAGGALCLASAAGLAAVLQSRRTTVRDYGAVGDGVADDTAALRAAFAAERIVRFEAGTYRISSELLLRSDQLVELSSATAIRQHTPGKNALVAVAARNVSIALNGGAIRGPGGWSRDWTGMQGQEGYRGVRFVGCTGCSIRGPGRVYNWGSAGVDITGGNLVACEDLNVEGTHVHGGALAYEENNQIGIYVTNDAIHGPADGIRVSRCEVSGVAQGFLREAQPGARAPTGPTLIEDCLFRDIPAQHGVYNQESFVTVRDCRFQRVALSAVKFQSGDANRILRDLSASGIFAEGLGGSVFEVATPSPYAGGVQGVTLEGRGIRVGRLLSVARNVRNLTATVSGEAITGDAVSLDKANLNDINVTVAASDIAQHGVIVSATNSSGITIRPTIRHANAFSGKSTAYSGILVESASAGVIDIIDADITDPSGRIVYGIFNSTHGTEVRLRGVTRISGASAAPVRATGKVVRLPPA